LTLENLNFWKVNAKHRKATTEKGLSKKEIPLELMTTSNEI
jgi:hypothetical protein